MSFLSWLGLVKMTDNASNVLKFPEPKVTPKMPYIAPPKPRNNECYRIGYDSEKEQATISLVDENGNVFGTLGMNQPASKQFIRMLTAAFPTTEELE